MEIKKTATIRVIALLLLLFCSPPNIMGQPGKKGAAKAVKVLTKHEGSVLREVRTGNTTSIAAQRYGSSIVNTNASKRPSAQAAVPDKKTGIKEANKTITPSRLPDRNVPIAPINKNKVIEYKPLSSEWDKKWIERIDYEVERARHLLNWEDEIDKELQSPEYNVPVHLDYNIEHDKNTSLIYVYYEYKPIAA